MRFFDRLDMVQWTGLPAGFFILILIAAVVVLLVLLIINMHRVKVLAQKYDLFMEGKNAQSLENILLERIRQMDRVEASDEENKEQIRMIMDHFDHTYQKVGVVKYNAFDEMGGMLSFSLALLNRKNDGFILNAMHSREGCFTYIKEVVNGNPITILSEEEAEALEMAVNDTYKVGA